MSITSNHLDTVMVMKYQIAVSGGAPVIRQKSIMGLKESASDQDIHDIATAIFDLLQYPLLEVQRNNKFVLTNEQP